jgi:hypothetical protein
MPGSETQIIGAELERVLPKVPTMFDRDDVFYAAIDKRPVEVISSRDMRVPLEIRPGGKTGYYNPDGGDLGRGDMPTFDKAIVNSVHIRHAVEMTAKNVWSTDNNRKAVLNSFRHNLATAMKEFRRNVDSQAMTDGTGTLGTITSVSTSAGVDTYTLTTDGYGARLIRYNMNLNVFNSTLTTCRTAGGPQNETTVTLYDLANKTIAVTPSVTGATAGDLLVSSGLQSTPPTGLLGVKYHDSNASTGTWLGFDRSLNPEIRANRVNGNSSALTLPLPRLAINKIGDRVGINHRKRCTAWTHPAQEQAYEELGFNVIRIDKAAKEEGLDMYFNDNMRIAGAPLKKSYSWDRTRIDFIDLDVWGRAELHPPGFYQNPDNKQRVWELRGGTGGVATSWIFYIVASFNIFMNNPAAASYIDSLAVPAGY